MGSIIYTYQRSKKKPIPLTSQRLLTLREHEKELKRLGVDKSRPTDLSDGPLVKRLSRLPVTQETAKKVAGTKPVNNWKLEESKNFTVAPAYNKGAYQVISKSNIKDIGR